MSSGWDILTATMREIVDHDHIVAGGKESLGDVGTNKPGAPGQHNTQAYLRSMPTQKADWTDKTRSIVENVRNWLLVQPMGV